MNDKVFISYAKEDYTFAEKLYDFLKENDFKPWLDKKEILPGQDWNYVLHKSLREANYIILLLSHTSVQKRGYVQREFKLSLEYYEEKLEDDIYLIPLKIDDCEVPDSLRKFQWVEHNSQDCFDLVLKSLCLQRNKYESFEKKQIASKEIFAYKELNEEYEYSNNNKTNFQLKSSYVQFTDESIASLSEVNAMIKGKNIDFITNSRRNFIEITGETKAIEGIDWYYDLSITPNMISKSVISLNENFYCYTGGAHGIGIIKGLNLHINPTFTIEIQDLFEYEDHAVVLNFVSNFCFKELQKMYNEWVETSEEEIELQTKETLFWEKSLLPEWDKYDSYFITKTGIEIIFNPYSVSGYAFGIQFVTIPFVELLKIVTEKSKLEALIQKIQ
ncbi:TIR domain-containing protein [Flavobacterium sp. RSSA_27]|uniref:TIR domain-containing protein n=1 Tax=Flavobacterium sp. RSSA_27 TaxID=3447667 RepID=UPI003F34282A